MAVIAVLINHLNKEFLPGGYLGVDVFFVISGYVVTSSLVHRKHRGWRDLLARFYQRRFQRLMPALILNVLAVSLIFSAFVTPFDDTYLPSLRTGFASLFGLSNLYLLRQGTDYFAVSTLYNPFTHTWSLGVEEQFYLIWPILLMICGVGLAGSRFAMQKLLLLSMVLMVVSLIFYLQLSFTGQKDAAFFLMPARFWELSIGCLAFLAHGLLRPGHGLLNGAVSAVLGLSLIGMIVALLFIPEGHRTAATLAIVLLTSVLMVVIDKDDPTGRVLSQPGILFVGLTSYSLYLWHWPVIVLARWTIGVTPLTLLTILVTILLLTLLSYRIETFFRNRRFEQGLPSKPLVFFPLTALLTGLISLLIQGPGKWAFYLGNRNSEIANISNMKKIAGTSINTINCFREPIAPLDQTNPSSRCHSGRGNKPTLYFEGDSHAHVLMPLGEKLLRDGNVNVSFFARGGCPFPHFTPWTGDRHQLPRYKLCGPHVHQRLQELLPRLNPGDAWVLVSSVASNFDPSVNPRSAASEDSYGKEISKLAAALQVRKAQLIVFAPLPVFSDRPEIMAPLSVCSWEWFRPAQQIPEECRPSTLPRSDHRRAVEAMENILRELEQRHPNLHVYHPLPAICPASSQLCSTHSDDVMLFSDSNHLTNAGAHTLHPSFRDFLKSIHFG